MESLLFGIGILISFIVWGMWKKTALDECRDKLFDIRDGAREHFSAAGIPLDNKTYLALRDLLNAQIRYTKKLNFPRFIAMTVAISTKPEVMGQLKKEIDKHLTTDDPELNAYIISARKNATEAMIQYIGETSSFLMLFSLVAWPLFVAGRLWTEGSKWARDQRDMVTAGARTMWCVVFQGCRAIFKIAPIAGIIIAMPARAGLIDKHMTGGAILEEYAYEASLNR